MITDLVGGKPPTGPGACFKPQAPNPEPRVPSLASQKASLPLAVFLMGPTAAGKTELAVEMVQRLPLEIVSVDSAMVYRCMDIGTAKPGADVLALAPHRLIDFVDPADPYSAARFRQDALREMADITARGKVPLLVGGTMLYFRALTHGLSLLPAANAKVRARIDALAAIHGWTAMHARLRKIDPVAAARIHPNDPQRVQRALEIFELTGRTTTELYAEPRSEVLQYDIVRLALIPSDRARFRDRIRHRFEHMLAMGLIDEVAALRRRADLSPHTPALRAVGYRQVWTYLDGRVDLGAMIVDATRATWHLAKRQLTWLRAEHKAQVFASESRPLSKLIEAVAAALE
jgi:tRNA dimethylallyltransferase